MANIEDRLRPDAASEPWKNHRPFNAERGYAICPRCQSNWFSSFELVMAKRHAHWTLYGKLTVCYSPNMHKALCANCGKKSLHERDKAIMLVTYEPDWPLPWWMIRKRKARRLRQL